MKVLAGVCGILLLLLVASFALPIERWRTGEMPQPPLRYSSVDRMAFAAARIWIDTDAACGSGARRDPDDCLALWSLAREFGDAVVGISTVFGNARLEVTDRITRELVDHLRHDGTTMPPVYRGCAVPMRHPDCAGTPGTDGAGSALMAALHGGELTVIALGPLTNIAAALERGPALVHRISRVIAVMGRRPGHRFHPTENRSRRAILFGHGPVFRDLNFELDVAAAEAVIRAGVPLTLVPYAVARRVLMTEGDLDRVAASGRAGAWVAARSRAWLEFWQRDVGLDGFYPFDLMAAAYVRTPAAFRCAEVKAWVGGDPLFPWFNQAPALLVTQDDTLPEAAPVSAAALYCDDLRWHEPGSIDRSLASVR